MSGWVSSTGWNINLASPGPIGNVAPSSGAFTTLSASSTVSGTGFNNYLASPPAIGGTAAAAGSFTTLQTTSTGKGTIFGSATPQNFYSAWQYNSTDVGYIGNGASIISGGGLTDFGMSAFTSGKLWLGSNNGASYAVLDASGNLGLGVTPSGWSSNGNLQIKNVVSTGGYTVATLPTGVPTGSRAYVTDALTPIVLTTVAGGGAVVVPVFYNGSAWIVG